MNYLITKPWLPERRMAQAIVTHLDDAEDLDIEDIIKTVRMDNADQQRLWERIPHQLRTDLVTSVLREFCLNATYTFCDDDEGDERLLDACLDLSEAAISAIGLWCVRCRRPTPSSK
jgi:hypothetical protein